MWETNRLGGLMEIARGGSPRPIKSYITAEEDGVNWIKIGDTEEGGKYIQATKEKIKPSGISRSRYVKAGDFLLSNSMSFGRPYILQIDGCIHDGWLVLSNYEGEFLADYLYYLLSSSVVKNQFEAAARGSTVRNLNIDLVSNVEVSYPPIAEQQRIVAKLDAAFAKIDEAMALAHARETQIETLQTALLSASFNDDAVIWETVKLGDVCSINNGGTPSSKEKSYWGDEIEWLTPKDMGKLMRRYVSKTERQITKEGLANSSAKLVPEKSVILSCRAPIGHVAINEVPMSFNQGCKGLIPNDKIMTEFLYYFLISSKELLNDLGTGTTFKEISAKTLSNVSISIPPLAEQQRIVAKLDAGFEEIKNAKNAVNRCKENYAALKSAILTQELQSEAA